MSWSDCDVNVDNPECKEPNKERCGAQMVAETQRDKIEYRKACYDRLTNPCHEKRIDECRITLCEKDLCNFALTPTATLIASAFRCIKCNSTISWEDCDDQGEEIICGAGFRKCSKLEHKKEGFIEYSKGCIVPLACGETGDKHMPDAKNREMYCCGQHFCNRVGINRASNFFFGALLLSSMMLVLFS